MASQSKRVGHVPQIIPALSPSVQQAEAALYRWSLQHKPRPLHPPIESTAYHEAGHAVAAIVQGLSFNEVTIVPGPGSLGNMTHPSILGYEGGTAQEQRSIARRCIIVAYAGLEAELLFNALADEWRADADKRDAFNLSREYGVMPRKCGMVGDDVHQAFLNKLRAEARRLVKQNWPMVEKIGAALVERKTLTESEALVCCGRVPQ